MLQRYSRLVAERRRSVLLERLRDAGSTGNERGFINLGAVATIVQQVPSSLRPPPPPAPYTVTLNCEF